MPHTDAAAQGVPGKASDGASKQPLQLSCLTRDCTEHGTSLQPNRAHVYLVGAQKTNRLRGSPGTHHALLSRPATLVESREALAMTSLARPVRKQKAPGVLEGSHDRYVWRPRTLLQSAKITARVDLFADARARTMSPRAGFASILDEPDFALLASRKAERL